MSPNNIFVYKNGSIRQEHKAYPDSQRYFYETITGVNRHYLEDLYMNLDRVPNTRVFQTMFVRYQLKNINVWIEE